MKQTTKKLHILAVLLSIITFSSFTKEQDYSVVLDDEQITGLNEWCDLEDPLPANAYISCYWKDANDNHHIIYTFLSLELNDRYEQTIFLMAQSQFLDHILKRSDVQQILPAQLPREDTRSAGSIAKGYYTYNSKKTMDELKSTAEGAIRAGGYTTVKLITDFEFDLCKMHPDDWKPYKTFFTKEQELAVFGYILPN